MQIHRLKLENFKRFRDFEIRLNPGICIIKGPNEAGKSTLLDSLLSGFFYDTTARIEPYRTWGSQTRPRILLEFSVAEQKLILKKDFEEPSVSIGYSDGSKEETSSKKIKKLLSGFLGFESDRSFLATSCIRQHELSSVVSENTSVKLENILLGGSESVDVLSIIKKLDSQIQELNRRKGTKSPGLLVSLSDEIQKLQEPLTRINALAAELEGKKNELTRLLESYKPKSILLERVRFRRQWQEENGCLIKTFNENQEKMDELKSLMELENKRGSHFKSLEHAESLYMRLYAYRLRWYWYFVFIVTFGLGYIVYKKIMRSVLNHAGCKSPDEFHRVYREYKEAHKTSERLKARLEGYSKDSLEEQKRDISVRLAVHEQKLTDSIKMAELGQEEMIRLEGEVKGLKNEIEELTVQCNEKEICIRENKRKNSGEDVDIEEKLDYLKESLSKARMRGEVLTLTKKMLEKARNDVLVSRMDHFNKKAAGYLSLFTRGRYAKIKTEIDTSGIRFIIYSPEKKEWVYPDVLSTGTQDQLYLAVRVALVNLITDLRRPPIIMDDPFTSFDRERLNSAMEVCKEIAMEYQVIIFTCTDRYDTYADNIVQLDYEPQEITVL